MLLPSSMPRRVFALSGVLAISLISAECSGASSASSNSVASGPFAAQAEQVIIDLAAGNYQAVWAMFRPSLQAQLSVAALANAWQVFQEQFQEQFGSYKSHGTPELIPVGSLDVEQAPMHMARGTEEARITFQQNGMIAGLYFLKSGAPPPAAS